MKLHHWTNGSKDSSLQKVLYKDWMAPVRWMLTLILILTGCAAPSVEVIHHEAEGISLEKIAIMPFQSYAGSGLVVEGTQCPLCGAVFKRGRIEEGAEERLGTFLFDFLQTRTGYKLVPPDEVQGIISQMLSRRFDSNTVPFITDIGKAVQADAILVGYIYRYEERVGTSYSVKNPASVAFDLHLIDVKKGTFLWKGRFDKTQKALSENAFQIKGFLKGGAKWLTVDELALQGLGSIMKTFPR